MLDLVGAVDLPTAVACLRRCRVFLGNDSGLMHLAAAAGTPTLGLFGPSHARRYGPWGPKAAFLRTPESYDELLRRVVPRGEVQGTLMDGLTVAAVLEAAQDLLRRTG
jgi:ADP-heptose:LPS heptosyltransferase